MIKNILKFLLGILIITFMPVWAVLFLLWFIWDSSYRIGNETIKQINEFWAECDCLNTTRIEKDDE